MADNGTVLVAGAGGFIGGHLVRALAEQALMVRAVDYVPIDDWHQRIAGVECLRLDLSQREMCVEAVRGVSTVYNLAADMGGMGFIEANKARCMLSVLINTHMLMSAVDEGIDRYFYASSACVYAADRQTSTDVTALRESDAYPAMPEDGYGWEKLFSERMCRHFLEDFGLQTRVARYHNVYGPHGTFEGGREKAPAAICRKIAEAKLSGRHEIEVWGDGQQTRSFTFIDDCVHGTQLIASSDITEPLNLGSDRLVSINDVIDIVEAIAGIRVTRRYDESAPQGVRGRNSDNTKITEALGWAPTTSVETGLEATYAWIYDQLAGRYSADAGRRSETA